VPDAVPEGTPAPYQEPNPNEYAAPNQVPYQGAPPPAKRRSGAIGTVIVLLIVALAVGAFFLFRDRLGNEVTSLQVGECFDLPQGQTEVDDVQRQPCNEAHDAEVIAVLVHPAPATEAFPVVSGFNDFVEEKCVPVFETYTGRTLATETELNLGWFQPTLSGWGGGDRGFSCYLTRVDDAKLTSSLKAP